jgi:glycosyltransferase involved in cell wall biosynthesis
VSAVVEESSRQGQVVPGPLARTRRVALLATSVDFGGIERVVLNLVRHLGPEVRLQPIILTRTELHDRTFLDRLETLGASPKVLYIDQGRLQYLSPLRNVSGVLEILRAEPCDLIHSHGYRADLVGLAAARALGLPVVSTCHGFTPNNRRLALYCRLNVMALRHFSRVMAVSARMRDDLIEGGVDARKVEVIANAVESACEDGAGEARAEVRGELGLGEDVFVIGFVGRLSEEKGLHHLLDALRLRRPVDRAWRLLVVGDGPRRRELEEQAREAGLEHEVLFVGFRADSSRWFAAMDAFVLPSLTEGTPMALLEAMAHRVPVVATAVGGVPAVVSHGVHGMLVPPSDPSALAGALREVGGRHDLRQALATSGYQRVREEYDVEAWAAKVRGVYEQVLEDGRA